MTAPAPSIGGRGVTAGVHRSLRWASRRECDATVELAQGSPDAESHRPGGAPGGILALARDVIGFQFIDPGPKGEAQPAATSATPSRTPSAKAVRRGPEKLRMVGGQANVRETEVDLDSEAQNWGVNSCAASCDINFRGNINGIEEAYGEIARSPADRESCRSATTYGYVLSPPTSGEPRVSGGPACSYAAGCSGPSTRLRPRPGERRVHRLTRVQ